MYSCTLHMYRILSFVRKYESTYYILYCTCTFVLSYIFMKVSYITVVLYVVHVYGSTEVVVYSMYFSKVRR